MHRLLPTDKQKIASFDVDAQNTFTPICIDELPVPGGTEIVDELNQQAKFASVRLASKEGHSLQAVWIADDEHPQLSKIAGENVDVRWVPHAIPGTKGFDLIDGLPAITDYDFVVWKGVECDMHPYGSCYHDFAEKLSTGVIEFLRMHEVTTIIVGGLTTDYCVKNTVLQLLHAGFKVIVNLGACRGIAPETVKTAIAEMKGAGAHFVNSYKELQ